MNSGIDTGSDTHDWENYITNNMRRITHDKLNSSIDDLCLPHPLDRFRF